MKNLITYFLLIIAISFTSSCIITNQHQITVREYINPDSTAIFSTAPQRPFKYGFALTKEECEKDYKQLVINYEIKKGDVIADVGAASGWLDGIYSVFVDSVIFYIQDIDTHYLNQVQFNRVVEHYTKQRTTPQTNQFYFVLGTFEKTNLPEAIFDKIIIHNTFHEFSDAESMIEDLSSKLKPGGKIIIFEKYSNQFTTMFHGGCHIKAYTVEEISDLFEPFGFNLTNATGPESSVFNFLTFQKNSSLNTEYSVKINTVNNYIEVLDSIHIKKVCNDSTTVFRISNFLKDHINEISKVYPTLKDYIEDLGVEWAKAKQKTCAVNTFQVNVVLYPEDHEVYYSLAKAQELGQKYIAAIANYSKAIELDPKNVEYYISRGFTFRQMRDYESAIDDYETAIEINPKDPNNYISIGEAFTEQGDDESALYFFTKAIELDPYNPNNYCYRAISNLNITLYKEGIADLDRAIKLNPMDWESYKLRAQTKKILGDLDGYKADLKKANEVKKKAKRIPNI